ncbi:uncharacterized protein LOC143449508 [Clavelina lepadiformis]|uniref:uncharacterized protein LOC143449508 n=1 Tax=Clavelina lepadiformis TaxID=159417 RepID=UPI0040419EE6
MLGYKTNNMSKSASTLPEEEINLHDASTELQNLSCQNCASVEQSVDTKRNKCNALQKTSRKVILKRPTFQYKSKNHFIQHMPYPSSDLIKKLGCLSLHKEDNRPISQIHFAKNTTNHHKLTSQQDGRLERFTQAEASSSEHQVVTPQRKKCFKFCKSNSSLLKCYSFKDTQNTNSSKKHNCHGKDYRNRSPTPESDDKKLEHSQPGKLSRSCSYQALLTEADISTNELASYMTDFLVLPKKMSSMAEMMYT